MNSIDSTPKKFNFNEIIGLALLKIPFDLFETKLNVAPV